MESGTGKDRRYSEISRRAQKRRTVPCGFSMETENMVENSRKKLEKKKLDMIAANNLKVAGAGFQGDTNQMTLITKEDETALQ